MQLLRSALAASVAFAAISSGVKAADEKSDVVDLTKDTFASFVENENLSLVEFFAPWCGHCQALKPHYEESATALLKEETPIKLAKVDCTVEEDVCSEQEVQGYPTLKVFRKGTASEYNGPRKADGIISYMKKQALPALSEVAPADLEEFKKKDKLVAVAYLADGAKELATFSSLADKLRDSYVFGHVADAEAAKAEDVKVPSIVLYRSFDEPKIVYSGKLTDESAIEEFIKAESTPLVDEVGPENFMTYAEAGVPLAYYFTLPDAADKDKDVEALRDIAKKHKGKLNFVWIDAVKFVNHGKGLNLNGENWPAFVIQDIQGNTKFPLELSGDRVGAISKHVDDFIGGKLKPSIKSEAVPEQDGPVWVLVADEFDKVVFDDKKDVLVEFYAPWCGHCKKLAPTWDTLGEKYAAHKDKIVIAKMDATANDVPPSAGFQVSSFPTIKFKPAGSKEFLDFAGDRTLDGFVDFIGQNAKNSVKIDLSAPANNTKPAAAEEHAKPKHEEL
ncbi:hypothetical protein IE81DRAFT_309237 [Ceraceosorus guamensis]|uniref:Protein disulfide-isomerase n=1 Tax=Ceraceosorus guamensis TaxID=1522189 RepID=A0A316W6H9_9BASI|nr:hypothetical protein IE81DRAFT_309237 [Ceraceosorus guamensis]PWN45526.1 hypothetical protein IE81DRAFT_309237 [Ceraceosorus guamensis]